jgi:hypothetical protein
MQSRGQGLGFDLGWSRSNRTRTFGHGSVVNVLDEVSYRNRMQNVVCEAIPILLYEKTSILLQSIVVLVNSTTTRTTEKIHHLIIVILYIYIDHHQIHTTNEDTRFFFVAKLVLFV